MVRLERGFLSVGGESPRRLDESRAAERSSGKTASSHRALLAIWARLQEMKKTAFFIKIGRDLTTRLDDLAAALEAGEIVGAGLNIFEQGPLPADYKLCTFRRQRTPV